MWSAAVRLILQDRLIFLHFILRAKCSKKCFKNEMYFSAKQPAGWGKAAPGSHPGVSAGGKA